MLRQGKLLRIFLPLVFLASFHGTATAIPTLQLDIGGGVYNPVLEDIVNTTNPFTLYGILTPDADSGTGDSYILSIAIKPQVGPVHVDLGSFTIDYDGAGGGAPQTVFVTASMTYDTPPIVAVDSGGNLAGHGVFPTFYKEFPFLFDPLKTTATYNTADAPGGPQAGSGSFYEDWLIDTSGLSAGVFLHFDLYQLGTNDKNDKFGIVEFAPPSHDASTVPEASALMLFGSGLVGLVLYRRKKRLE